MSRKLVVAVGVLTVVLLLALAAVIALAVLYHDANTDDTTGESQAVSQQPDVKFSFGQAVCTVTAAAVNEASGLCMSRRHPGVLYTHNDSGDKPRMFAINSSNCQLLATITIQGAINVDFEDIACGSCGQDFSDTCVYIGDTGSNAIWRPYNTVYRVKEPDTMQEELSVPINATLKFSWDEYDGETLMVDPEGMLYVVSKSADGDGRLYSVPATWDSSDVAVLSRRDGTTLQLDTYEKNPTGGDISPDGTEVLIKSQGDVFYYHIPDKNYAVGMSMLPRKLPYSRERQGESVAWGDGTADYYTLSEGQNSTLYRYVRRQ